MAEDNELRSSEDLWKDITIYEGESKADAMIQLALGMYGKEEAPYARALAKEAGELYLQDGSDGSELDFVWVWGVIAETSAALLEWDEAIEAAKKCLELSDRYIMDNYYQMNWDLIRWYLSAYRFEEAQAQFDGLYLKYKETSEIDFSMLPKVVND